MNNKLIVFLSFFILIGVLSCGDDEVKIPPPDVNHIQISDFKWVRFDQEVAKLNPDNIVEDYTKLVGKYPIMTDLYFKRLLQIPFENQDTFFHKISQILKAPAVKAVQDTIDHFYANTNDIESQIRKSCQYLKYFFPKTITPNFYTIQTEFGFQKIIFPDIDKDAIGIGLDLFLGEGFDYKYLDPRNESFSDYLTRSYNKDHIAKKAMELLVIDLIGNPPGKRFVDLIINNGKKLYILEKILPSTSDTVIMEFSKNQMEWVKSNELEMWSFFLDNEFLYSTNSLKFNKYTGPSPNSPGMPLEAPGGSGNYIGLQIVKSFMRRNPDKTLEDLLEFKDAQKLLELSKYKPKRR